MNIFVVVVDLILCSNFHCKTIVLCSDVLCLHSLRYQIIIRVLYHWFYFISLISTIGMLFFSKVHCPHCLCWKNKGFIIYVCGNTYFIYSLQRLSVNKHGLFFSSMLLYIRWHVCQHSMQKRDFLCRNGYTRSYSTSPSSCTA